MKIVLIFLLLFPLHSYADGFRVYTNNCLTCHGEQLDGNGPAGKYMNPHPRNLITGNFKNGDSHAQILETVTKGLSGTAMPSFEAVLSLEERNAVVAFIRGKRGGNNNANNYIHYP